MTADQLTFSTVRDWREPQLVTASGLTQLLAEAASAGFKARVLETRKKPFGYRVMFCQMSNAREKRESDNLLPEEISRAIL